MSDDFEREHGTEDACPKNGGGPHEPDWSSVEMTKDGGAVYVDVCCRHCWRSGTVSVIKKTDVEVSW